MKKALLILSAIALSGSAFVIAQEEGERRAPRGGDRGGRGGAGMFAAAPLFKALKMDEAGAIALPKSDEEKAAFLKAIASCDKDGDGKLTRVEIFGERTRGGRGGRGAGGDRPARPDRPDRPAAE